jgi:hypothetical protein
MRILVRFASALLVLVLPAASWAVDLSGQSRTYLQYREATDSTKLLPLYEYLDFRAGDKSETFSFHFGGWYRYDLKDESFGKDKSTGDLQYAYLRYRSAKNNAYANLGRFVVNQGVASEHLDGAAAGTDLWGGFEISAYGGIPVETDLDSRSGDSVYGGRISQGLDGLYNIGVSYLLEKNDSIEFRKEEGVDLWFRPIAKAELTGTMLYNAITSDNALTSLYLTLGSFGNLTLRTQYMDVSYKDYFTTTTMSAFLLSTPSTTGPLDPNEKLALIGEEASLSFGKTNISVDYKKYDYDIAGSADYYGAKVAYSDAQYGSSGLSLHRMDGETKDRQYSEYRLYTSRKIQKVDLTADALMVKYDMEINGVKSAYTVALAGGYALSPKTKVGADIEYAKNPYYDKDVRAFLKLVHNFDFTFAAPAPPARKKGRK